MQRVLIIALVALSLNALAGWAGLVNATTKTRSVQVISQVHYDDVLGHPASVSAGSEGESVAKCGAGYEVVSGGFHATGNYLIAPPSVVTSEPQGDTAWDVKLLDAKTGGSVTFSAYALCEKPDYVTVQAS